MYKFYISTVWINEKHHEMSYFTLLNSSKIRKIAMESGQITGAFFSNTLLFHITKITEIHYENAYKKQKLII